MKKSKRPVAAFVGVVVFGFVLYFVMLAIEPGLKPILFDYNTWLDNMASKPLWALMWMFGDATEPHFHKSLFGGIFVFLGSIIAYVLDRNKSKLRLTPISYGNGVIWPWIFAAAFISMGISTILFGSLRIEGDAWIGTFVPYVSIASAVILIYGARVEVLFTGAILGAIFSTPITMFMRSAWLFPHQLPGIIGSVSGMWIGGIFVFEICHYLPWMKVNPNTVISPGKIDGEISVEECKHLTPNKFFIRRMIADYSEPMFVGNEIAGGALIIGTLFSWVLNPLHPVYGMGILPALLFSEILTGAISIFVYWNFWMEKDGWFPTFVPVVSVAPAMVIQFGTAMPIIIIGAVFGAISCPAMAMWINRKIPAHWHGMIGFTASMAINSFACDVLLRYLIQVFPFIAK